MRHNLFVTVRNHSLYAYSLSSLYPTTYPLDCFDCDGFEAGVATESHLYICAKYKLFVFTLPNDDSSPFSSQGYFETKILVNKMMKAGSKIILGGHNGGLLVFDTEGQSLE